MPDTTAPVNLMSLKGLMKQIHIPCDKGKYYGYPKCCVQAFNNQLLRGRRPHPEQLSVTNHGGFVPCLRCSKLIIDGKIKIEDLIQNRECELPYPNGDGKRIQLSNVAGWISQNNSKYINITKRVKLTDEHDYNSVLSRILINRIIIRRAAQVDRSKNLFILNDHKYFL